MNAIPRLVVMFYCLTVALPLFAPVVSRQQSLIPQQILEKMSKSAIRKKYPLGIRVTQKDIPEALMKKLQALEKSGYLIKWDQADNEVLRTHTHYVIRKSGLKYYYNKILGINSGCSSFFHDRFLEHALNKSLTKNTTIQSLEGLESRLPDFYHSILKTHRYWAFIGYDNMHHATSEVLLWLDKNGKAIENINKVALKQCQITLNSAQLTAISRIMALQYLAYAVEGLYYKSQLSPVTYYRQLAVESLGQD